MNKPHSPSPRPTLTSSVHPSPLPSREREKKNPILAENSGRICSLLPSVGERGIWDRVKLSWLTGMVHLMKKRCKQPEVSIAHPTNFMLNKNLTVKSEN
jgi:hypothetical protein